jgi:hypothetical protein
MKNCILLILLLFTGKLLWAVPTIYPKHSLPRIYNNTNSSVVPDSENSSKFYVLPPSKVEVKVLSMNSVTANIGFCKEIADIQKYNANTLQLLNNLKQREYELLMQITDHERKIRDAKVQIAEYVRKKDLWQLVEYDKQLVEMSTRLDHLYAAYKDCKQFCAPMATEIEGLQEMRNQLEEKRFLYVISRSADTDEYLRQHREIENLEGQKQASIDTVRKVQTDLKELYLDFVSMYDAHVKREGAKISVEYDSGWSRNVARLQFDNPMLRFEKISTQNAVVRADAYSNLLPGASIMGFNFGGVGNINGPVNMEAYPEHFSGNATLNLLGACPILYPQLFGLPMNDDRVNPQKMKFGLTVGFQFPSEFTYDVTVRYNMYKLYELTQKQGKKGGFLSSSSWSTKDENEYYKDAFKVDWTSQSDRLMVSPEQKANIEKDLRRNILSRLASFMVLTNPPRLGSSPEPDKPGALVLSDSLSQACGIHVLCKGASMGLRLIYDVFSSSSMTDSYKQTINVESVEVYSNKQVLLQPMITTYF